MYTSPEDLFGELNQGDDGIIRQLVTLMTDSISGESIFVSPLTVGNHIDHQLVRIVADLLPNQVWYYPDFPYTCEYSAAIPGLIPNGYQPLITPVSDLGLNAWQESVAAYASQISTFWSSIADLRISIAKHADQFGGVTLWHPTNSD